MTPMTEMTSRTAMTDDATLNDNMSVWIGIILNNQAWKLNLYKMRIKMEKINASIFLCFLLKGKVSKGSTSQPVKKMRFI